MKMDEVPKVAPLGVDPRKVSGLREEMMMQEAEASARLAGAGGPESGPLGPDHESGGVSPDLEEAADMGSADRLGGDPLPPVEQVVIRADPIVAQTMLRAVTALGNLYMRMDIEGASEQRAKLIAADRAIREGFATRGQTPVTIKVGKKLLTMDDADNLDSLADKLERFASRSAQDEIGYLRSLAREAREGNSR